jgi:hypothetical protein
VQKERYLPLDCNSNSCWWQIDVTQSEFPAPSGHCLPTEHSPGHVFKLKLVYPAQHAALPQSTSVSCTFSCPLYSPSVQVPSRGHRPPAMASFFSVVTTCDEVGKTQMPSTQSAPLRHEAVASHGVQLPPHDAPVCHPPTAVVQEEYSVHPFKPSQIPEKQSVPREQILPALQPYGALIELYTKPLVQADNYDERGGRGKERGCSVSNEALKVTNSNE